jgi:hypothetical protein
MLAANAPQGEAVVHEHAEDFGGDFLPYRYRIDRHVRLLD